MASMKSIGYTTDVMTSASKLIQHHGDKMKYHRWLITLLIFMSIFFVHNESPVQTSSDSRWFVPTAMSIIKERNVNIDEYDFFIEQARNYGVEELDGNKYNFFPIGTAIVAVPFVWLFDFYFDKTIGLSFNTALKHDPLEDLEKFIASIIVALTAVMIFLIAEALCRNIPLSVLVVCIFSFCTPAWSTASRALWQHGPSMLMLTMTLC